MKSEPEDLPRFKRRCAVAVAVSTEYGAIWFVVGFNRQVMQAAYNAPLGVVLPCLKSYDKILFPTYSGTTLWVGIFIFNEKEYILCQQVS